MKFLKILFYIIAVLVVVILVSGALLPGERSITREITIEKPASVIFPLVADFGNWHHWDPWRAMDSNAVFTISEKSCGIDSKQEWKGEIIGEGYLLTKEYDEYSRVLFDLVFDGNEEKVNQDEWLFEETASGTNVKWSTHLNLSFPMERIFGLFIENMLGPQKEEGLSKLKEYAENLKQIKEVEMEIVSLESKPIYYISDSSDMQGDDIANKLGAAYGELGQFCGMHNIQMTEAPLAITTKFDMNGIYEFDAAFVVNEHNAEPEGRIKRKMTYAGKAIKATHIGAYKDVDKTYYAIEDYIKEHNFEPNGDSWEQYISDPADTPEEELVTFVFFPVK
jgi:effector-binding domain-containing protein